MASISEINGRTVWVNWEGPQPPYIALCIRTIIAHNANVVILDRMGFEELYERERDLNIDSLALNHKSDFIRAYLLRYYGGLYVDADCLVLKYLASVIDLGVRHGFVGYREPLGYMSCNFMASMSGGKIITEHYDRICATLRSSKKLAWLDLASTPMDTMVSRFPCRAPGEEVHWERSVVDVSGSRT
jgi:hypothetical protein